MCTADVILTRCSNAAKDSISPPSERYTPRGKSDASSALREHILQKLRLYIQRYRIICIRPREACGLIALQHLQSHAGFEGRASSLQPPSLSGRADRATWESAYAAPVQKRPESAALASRAASITAPVSISFSALCLLSAETDWLQ
jgi:hypothetical protein